MAYDAAKERILLEGHSISATGCGLGIRSRNIFWKKATLIEK